LKCLTLFAINRLDFFDGKQWEKYLRRTQITKFNFQFILYKDVFVKENLLALFDSFRSSFWIEEKHWYVALSETRTNRSILFLDFVHNVFSIMERIIHLNQQHH